MPLLPPPPVPDALMSGSDVNVKENSFVFRGNEQAPREQEAESDTAKSVAKVKKNSYAFRSNERPPMRKAKTNSRVNSVKIWRPKMQRNTKRKRWDDDHGDSTRVNDNRAERTQPITSGKTKNPVEEKDLPRSDPDNGDPDDAVSDIDLLQALLKIMPKKNRKSAIKKIVNSFIFTSDNKNTNMNIETTTTTTSTTTTTTTTTPSPPPTTTTAKPTTSSNIVGPNLESDNLNTHGNIDVRAKRKNTRDKYFEGIEQVKLTTTDIPEIPLEITESYPPFLKGEMFEHQHPDNFNTKSKNRRKSRHRKNNMKRRNMRFESSRRNSAKRRHKSENVERENLRSKLGFTGMFERMYKRLFGKLHFDATTTPTTTTTSTPPPDYHHYDEVTDPPIDYDYANVEYPRYGQENRERYRDIAKSKYNWNRQSSKESFSQYRDVEKIDFPTENEKHYIEKPFLRKRKSGVEWNVRPKTKSRKIHSSTRNEVLRHWKTKSNDERPELGDTEHTNYVPYDFEVGEVRGIPHNIESRINTMKSTLANVGSVKKLPSNSKTPTKDNPFVEMAEYVISEPEIHRTPKEKIIEKKIVPRSQYDFEANIYTPHDTNKIQGPNPNEPKTKSYTDDAKPSAHVDHNSLLKKMVQEAIQKALAKLNLGQSNRKVITETTSSPQVKDDYKITRNMKQVTPGPLKSVDFDRKRTLTVINKILPPNSENDNFQWIDPVSVAKFNENSNTSKEVTNADTMESSQFLKKTPSELQRKVAPETNPGVNPNTSKEVTKAETVESSQYFMSFEFPKNVQMTTKSPYPSWMTMKTFTRRRSNVKKRVSQRLTSHDSQHKANKISMYYIWRNGGPVLVKTVKAPSYSGQTKKNKSKESKNISAQKGSTTLSPYVDSPYFDYALPATDHAVW
jgi:hypothetical protein